MKPSHYITPRTLADATFSGGYSVQEQPSASKLLDFILALVIGIALGALLVHWAAS